MKHAIVLCLCVCLCGCAQPVNVTINTPGAERRPDFAGSILLIGYQDDKPLSYGSVAVVAQRGAYWYGVTCQHNVSRYNRVRVDGQLADVWVEDEPHDLALVRWKSGRTYPVYIVGKPVVGQTAWVPGWTLTFADDPASMDAAPLPVRHVRRGVVSWVKRNSVAYDGGAWMGFSGAPLLSDTGELLGLAQKMHPPLGHFLVAIHARHVETLLFSLPED